MWVSGAPAPGRPFPPERPGGSPWAGPVGGPCLPIAQWVRVWLGSKWMPVRTWQALLGTEVVLLRHPKPVDSPPAIPMPGLVT